MCGWGRGWRWGRRERLACEQSPPPPGLGGGGGGWRLGRRARRTRAIAVAAPSRRGRAAAVRKAVLVVVVASAASGRDAARAPIPRAVVAAPAATKTDPRPTAPTTTARETPSLARCGSRERPFATVMIHRATHIVRHGDDDDDLSRETSCDRVIARAPTAGATLSARPAAERRPRRGGDADADGVRRGIVVAGRFLKRTCLYQTIRISSLDGELSGVQLELPRTD